MRENINEQQNQLVAYQLLLLFIEKGSHLRWIALVGDFVFFLGESLCHRVIYLHI